MPEPSKNNIKFENYAAKQFSPFVVYRFWSLMIALITTVRKKQNVSGTAATEK